MRTQDKVWMVLLLSLAAVLIFSRRPERNSAQRVGGDAPQISEGTPTDDKLHSLVSTVSELRKLPMLRPIKFAPVPSAEIDRRLGARVASRHTSAEWQAMERAYIALGLAEGPFDLPHALIGLEFERSAGVVDSQGDVIFYIQDLQMSQREASMEMVKLITEALIAQNLAVGAEQTRENEDAAQAFRALIYGDVQRVGFLYDKRLHRIGDDPPPEYQRLSGYAAPPAAIWQLWEMPYSGGIAFVTQSFPPESMERLNAAYANPPRTTAEILHPEYYANPNSWTPCEVRWPDERLLGEKPLHSGSLGEGGLFVWLSRNPRTIPSTAGLRGDRYAIWDGGSAGDTWLMETRWADENAAAAFESSARAWPIAVYGVRPQKLYTEGVYATHVQGRAFRVLRGKDKMCVYVLGAGRDERADALVRAFVQR